MSPSVWSRLRRQLEQQLDPDEFSTWFGPLKVQSENSETLVLEVPNARFLHTLEESYRPTVDHAIAGLDGAPMKVLFSIEERGAIVDAGKDDKPLPGEQENGTASTSRRQGQFDLRYIFDSFVVGNSNQFAHAAARAVAESPSHSYNPLFLYGGVGLGKTHLLHAIGHEIQAQRPQLKVMYLAAEQFVNELINSIRFDRMPAFRERYRTIDVLLIDDIQFLANKERTQEEFFHTFNTLYTSQKQIILSSDSSPRQIPTLEERLRSRFEWGLIADIQPPDLETKIAILRRKAEAERIELPDEVADFIAHQVRSNVRELEGLLNRVIAFSMLTAKPLSLALARETLRDILPEDRQRTGGADIVKLVARHYGLKVGEIKSKSNARQIAFPRQVAMYLCKRLTEMSFPEIGKLFGNKHHSTVMYSVEKIDKLRASDADLDRTLESLEEKLR
ncbi:MAG: chromosomal replication initiator protein DnaA [Acidobacteriota bacterium]